MTQPRPPHLNFFESLLKLTRFWNLVIIGLGQYFTAAFLINYDKVYDPRLLMLTISTIMIAAGGYIINDYYDVKIDLINKPDRVVVGRGITRRYAILFHVTLSVGGILIGAYLSWWIGLVNAASVFMLWLYSNALKRMPLVGNLSVAVLTGVAIALVDVLYHSHSVLIYAYALFAFFMTLVREIVKDMEDLKGDNTFGCRTLPIVWGLRRTKVLIYAVVLIFCLVVITLNERYVGLSHYYFVIFLFLPLAFLITRMIKADTKRDFRWISNFCKLIMLVGILTMTLV